MNDINFIVQGHFRIVDDKGMIDIGEQGAILGVPDMKNLEGTLAEKYELDESLEGQRVMVIITFPDIEAKEK